MCKSRTMPPRWFKCIRPEHLAHGGVMLCTVQCRPASACARKSLPRGCTPKETRQDKTMVEDGQYMCKSRIMPRDGKSA